MPAKNSNEFTIDFGPPYELRQPLPHNSNVFAAALLASEKILSIPDNAFETRYSFDDIPCDNALLQPSFAAAIPGTTFSSYNVSVPVRTKLGQRDIQLHLFDADNPKRKIKIHAPTPASDRRDELRIEDNYPDRKPRSLRSIGRSAVQEFLAWQLQAFGAESLAFESEEEQLGMLLGQYAQGDTHTIQTAETQVSDRRVIHTERDEIYDAVGRTTGKPSSIVHSTWLTGILDDEALGMAEDMKVRTIARFDGRDIWNPGNSLTYEVEAAIAHEPEALTKHALLMQRAQKERIARTFAACLGDYLKSER